MNTSQPQTFHIPVSFAAFGISDVDAQYFGGAVKKTDADNILPTVIDRDGGYYIEVNTLNNPTKHDVWVQGNTMTHTVREVPSDIYQTTRTLKHYGVAVVFRLGGIVTVTASTLQDAINLVANEEPLPERVFVTEDVSILDDAVDHGKQNIPTYGYYLSPMTT